MCYFRLRCGVNEMFTLLGCSSHSPFITPLSSPYSYPRLGQIYFLLSSPSKSTFISLTLHPVAPTSLLTRSSSPWHLSLQSHSACLPTMFLIPFFFPPSLPCFFHVFPSCPWQLPHIPGPLFLRVATWQLYFLPVFPSSESYMCHQPCQIISRSLRTNHFPHHSLYICTPMCSWHSWTAGPSKMGPVGCPKTLVTNYQSMLCNIPEERRSHKI